jgi:hypothetical protein
MPIKLTWGCAPHPGSVACGDPDTPRRSLAGAPCAPRTAMPHRGPSVAIAVGLLLALLVTPVRAHHAFSAEFDANKPVKFEATVVRMEWVNPHAWIYIDVPGAGGKFERWAIEAGTPNVLFRRGFTKKSLEPGTKIVVDGYQAKDGTRRANGRNLTFPDGRTLFVGSSGTGAPQP